MEANRRRPNQEILTLLDEATKMSGHGVVIPAGSVTYSNPLGYDEFPNGRLGDIDVCLFCDTIDAYSVVLNYRVGLSNELSPQSPYEDPITIKERRYTTKIIESLRQVAKERGYELEVDDGWISIVVPKDKERKIPLSLRVIDFDRIKAIWLEPSLFTSQVFGGNKSLGILKQLLEERGIGKRYVVDNLYAHYMDLHYRTKELAERGNPKFYKRFAEMSKLRGERPEVREAFLRKFELWKEYIANGGMDVETLSKMQKEQEAMSIDYADFDKAREDIERNITGSNEGTTYRLRVTS